jgi:hypothetical protein
MSLNIPEVRVRGRKGYGSLPADQTAAIAMLEQRTQELIERVQDAEEATEDAVGALNRDLAAITARIDDAVTSLEALTHRVASGGIRLQLAGFLAVGAGLALQLVATFL